MKTLTATLSSILVAALLLTPVLDANAKKPKKPKKPQLEYDQDVTPVVMDDLIFGSGNKNGFFTTSRKNGVEVGLRAKIRFPSPKNPDGTISNGDGTYNLPAGERDASHPLTALWSYDWTVNTDYDGSSGKKLSDFVYELGMDGDPSSKASYLTFDPIAPPGLLKGYCADHAMGDNFTVAGGPLKNQSVCTTKLDYLDRFNTYTADLDRFNVAQQSWRYDWYVAFGTSLERFDPKVPGEYTIYLKVKEPGSKGKTVAESRITVLVTAP